MPQSSNSNNQTTLALANMVGQIGCATSVASLVIIGLSFGGGYLIDQQFGTWPIFTFIFLLASFPVTLYAIVRLSLSALDRSKRIQERIRQEIEEQERKESNGFSESK